MSESESLIIYYFSGTGNAAAVSSWIAGEAENLNKHCRLINLAKKERTDIPQPPENSMIGFIGPTHGFNFPPILMHFLFRFPRGKGNKVFFINTRAGMKMGKFFLPGLSGMALYFSAILFYLKEYKIIALRSIDLPSNWISIHPALKEKVFVSIIKHRKKQSIKIAGELFSGKRNYRGLLALPIDLAITPIAVLYYFIGRFFLAKTFIASKDCTNCGLCDTSCPVKAIKIIDNRRFWSYKCESCMKCMNLCPERAIETAHGFMAVVIFILNGFVLVELNKQVDLRKLLESFLPDFLVNFTHFAINNIVLVLMIFLSYLIIHYLMRFMIFERIIVLSSLTHLKFWRRYRPSWKNYIGKL